MSTRVVEQVDDWDERQFSGGYRELHELSEADFSGVVRAGGAELYMTRGTVVGIRHGSIEAFEGASGTVYEAPTDALPLLAVMQDRSDEVRAKYYTEDTSISEVDKTLKDGGFTGYVELSENVLSGDYYLVYHKGHSMAVAYVGNSGQLLTEDEAFERADGEVGIYEVRPVDIEPIEIPEPTGSATEDETDDVGAADVTAATAAEAADDAEPAPTEETDATPDDDAADPDEESVSQQGGPGSTAADGTSRGDTTDEGSAEPSADTGSADTPADDGAVADRSTTTGEPAESPGTTADQTETTSTAGRGADRATDTGTTAPTDETQSSPTDETVPIGERAEPDERRERVGSEPDERRQSRERETGVEETATVNETATGGDSAITAVTSSETHQRSEPETTAGTAEPTASQPTESRGRQESGPESSGHETGGQTASEQSPSVTDDPSQLETRSIPSLNPERTKTATTSTEQSRRDTPGRSEASAGERASQQQATESEPQTESQQSTQQEPTQDPSPEPQTGATERETTTSDQTGAATEERASAEVKERIDELQELLSERDREIQRLESDLQSVESENESLREQLEEVRDERDELQSEVEKLESELRRLEEELGAATDAQQRMTPQEALSGTDIFVRYRSKGDTTLEKAHEGGARKDDVTSNLRLEKHTQFDADISAVGGRAYDEFLEDTVAYKFVRWVVEDLLFEIQSTGHTESLTELYDALPKINRIELNGAVNVTYVEEGQETQSTESFDVVFRERMGDPLLVANINESRQGASEGMMEQLITAAERVGQTSDQFASAFLVTESFFEPEALETVTEATRGGLLSRDKRKSFVNLSRKQGYHLCLVEARNQNFHLEVPEL